MRRWLAVCVAVLPLVLGLGCGGEEEPSSAALGYVPADAAGVLTISTDLESDQWQALEDRLLAGPLSPRSVGDALGLGAIPPPTSLEGYLRQGAALAGLDYDEDVEPLLGGELVVAASSLELSPDSEEASAVVALDTGDGETMRGVLERLELSEQGEHEGATIYADESGFTQFAVDGDVLLYAFDAESGFGPDPPLVPNRALAEAIDRERQEDGLDPAALEASDLPEDALIRLHADLAVIAEEPGLARLSKLPWLAALESLDATASISEDELALDAVLSTDPEGLSEEDLPLATGVETPELVRRDGEIAGASADQSQTTTFLYAAVREAFPDSRFVRDVARLERELGIDFEADFLEQFSGPSASSLTLSDEFAARSEVADPEAMARTLGRIAPDVGRLVQDLQGLQGRGLIPLFLLAPDAPIAPGVLGASRIEVSRIPGEPDLYLISELIPPGLEPVTPLPREIVFGLLDGVFVVASDLDRAREIVAAAAEPVPVGLEGASVAAGDLAPLQRRIEAAAGFDPGPLGELTASSSASTEELRASARIALP